MTNTKPQAQDDIEDNLNAMVAVGLLMAEMGLELEDDMQKTAVETARKTIQALCERRVLKARFDEHKIIMANMGAEYSSAIHNIGEKKDYDPALIKKVIKARIKSLQDSLGEK